jgi:ectoine hydroxylase-related dioxygenase (phytanoyl-CoA dioxygenase family)
VLFHHANGRAMLECCEPKEWHHDYDGFVPFRNHEPSMVHICIYPCGLTDDNGPLLVLPDSHGWQVDRSFPSRYGHSALEGMATITGAAGMTLVFNSALWHARRLPQRLPRYDVNVSFCKPGAFRPERSEWFWVHEQMAASCREEHRGLFRKDVLVHAGG